MNNKRVWYRGRSINKSNGFDPDIPTFGRFGCVVDTACPVAEENEDYEDEGSRYCFRFEGSFGGSGGSWATKEEAILAAESMLLFNGYTTNRNDAIEDAKRDAERRHSEYQGNSKITNQQ